VIPLLGIDNVHVECFMTEFTRFVDEEKFQETEAIRCSTHDVMITIMGTVGRCCVRCPTRSGSPFLQARMDDHA